MSTKQTLIHKPHENVAYSDLPFYDIPESVITKLSPQTQKALASNNVIYGKAFLANTLMNHNDFRITDNKYIAANKDIIQGRPMTFGTKVLEKYHHPRFYEEIDVSNMTPEEEKAAMLAFQEKDRIGDMTLMEYNKDLDQWDVYYIISHPDIVEDVRAKKLELPKYVSPYFFNQNEPAETGPDLREAEILHLSYVDEPAYGVEAARVRAYCDSKDGSLKTCLARMVGAGVISKEKINQKPPCACGMMAGFENKLDRSFYIENPKEGSKKAMSSTTTQEQITAANGGKPVDPNQVLNDQEKRIQEALAKMKETDKSYFLQNKNPEGENKKADDATAKNPSIPVEFQDLVNIQIEKERTQMNKQFAKQLEEKDAEIEALRKDIAKREEKDRESLLNRYIHKELYDDEKTYKERVEFFKSLAKENNIDNEKLEKILADHYQVRELKVELTGGKKGKGAGLFRKGQGAGKLSQKDLNPFDLDSDVGMLNNNVFFRGLEAGTSKNEEEEDTSFDKAADDTDNTTTEQEETEEEGEESDGFSGNNGGHGKGAAAILRGL